MMKTLKNYFRNRLIFAKPLSGKQISVIPGEQKKDAGEE